MKVERGVMSVKELIPMMNRVFHKNFPKLLPKLYTTDRYSDNHYYIKDNNKYIGALASIPNRVHVYDKTLNVRGIGMVSCVKAYRGHGVMSSLLKSAIADAEVEDVDYMFLSGNRQRYEHYGFVPAGYKYTFTLTNQNFKYMTETHEYTFHKVEKEDIDELVKIYASQDIYYDREELMKTIHSWNIKKVYVVRNSMQNIVGYIATYWYKIVDFAVSEPQNMAYIVKAFAKTNTKFFGRIEVSPNNIKAIESLSQYAQSTIVESPAFFNVINYRRVVEACLDMESRTSGLSDCNINIVIEGKESFRVSCKDNCVSVSDFAEGIKTITLPKDKATLYLFSPTMAGYSGLPFTLKLFIPMCDNV